MAKYENWEVLEVYHASEIELPIRKHEYPNPVSVIMLSRLKTKIRKKESFFLAVFAVKYEDLSDEGAVHINNCNLRDVLEFKNGEVVRVLHSYRKHYRWQDFSEQNSKFNAIINAKFRTVEGGAPGLKS